MKNLILKYFKEKAFKFVVLQIFGYVKIKNIFNYF